MSTAATLIRQAIVERLTGHPDLDGIATIRTQPLPQLQNDELPALTIVIMGETLTPDGDENASIPQFVSDITIGISVVTGFAEPFYLDRDLDERIDAIEGALLTDPTFVRGVDRSLPKGHPERDPLFEAVSRIQRRRIFPQDGEAYFAELRLELTFVRRVSYPPVIRDRYLKTVLTARPAGSSQHTPSLSVVIDQAQ